MNLITCKNISFVYDGVPAVKDLDFSVEPNDYLCIVGENGAGKSTLVKGLLRLKKPASGTIHMGNGLLAKEIGYLPQQMGITKLKNRCYRELSGGQQQRVLLARALCATKKVILLDEPAAGLDPVVTQNLYELIRQINEDMGITIIMVSHDIHAAVQYAKHILHLCHSQLFFGTTEDYRNSEVGSRFIGGVSHA